MAGKHIMEILDIFQTLVATNRAHQLASGSKNPISFSKGV